MNRRRTVIALLFVFASFGVFASTITISNYNFMVDGRTRDYSLDNLLVPSYPEVFDSEDSLVSALDRKLQVLANLRIYSEFSYDYSLIPDGPDSYLAQVSFNLKEAHTLFILPYPKYDTNYGARLGLKVYEKDLFGTLASISSTQRLTFQPEDWKIPGYEGELNISDLVLWNGAVMEFGGELTAYDRKLDSYHAYISVSDQKLYRNIKLAFSADVESVTIDRPRLTFGVKATGINAGKVSVIPSVLLGFEEDSSSLRPRLDFSLVKYGIELGLGIFVDFERLSEESRYLPSVSDMVLSAGRSADDINWYGNFRQGIGYSYNLTTIISKSLVCSQEPSISFSGDGSFSGFCILGKWFNGSARAVFLLNQETDPMGDYLRGIRNVDINDTNHLAMIINTNLTSVFPLPGFIDFLDAYVNVFADVAMTKETFFSDPTHYYGIGLEGIGILRNYPGYPIRLSVGFDINKLRAYLEGTGEFDFYEIYFGMGFFF